MDRKSEVRRTPKGYLSSIEMTSSNEAKGSKRVNKNLSLRESVALKIYDGVNYRIQNGHTDGSIQDYLKSQRATKEYKEAFSGGRDNKNDIDLNASSSLGEWE